MLKKIFSSINYNFPRVIVYMLQSSEYKVENYLKWFADLPSFKNVEKRKKLVRTSKAQILFFAAWFIFALDILLAVYFIIFKSIILKLFGVVLMLALPYILGYGIIIPLVLLTYLVQKPLEFLIIRSARNKLKTHKAVKIAVAGSFGKTTMREILKSVIGAGAVVAAPPENHNTLLGISSFIQTLKGDEEVLIFELGEYFEGDIKEMCELVNPDIGVITGVNEAHLDKMKFLEVTTRTIFELADYLKGRPVYVNGENKLAAAAAYPDHMLYTRAGLEDWKVENAITGLDGTTFTVNIDGNKYTFHSHLLGLHQVGPLVAAAYFASTLKISIDKIMKGVSETRAFEHRLAPHTDSSGVTMIDDSYNGNPDGVKVVIEFLAGLQGQRRFYVTPGLVEMGDRTEVVHRDIGRELARAGIEKVVLVENSVSKFIEAGLKDGDFAGEVIIFENALKLFKSLPYLTTSGDIVLLQNDWPDQYY